MEAHKIILRFQILNLITFISILLYMKEPAPKKYEIVCIVFFRITYLNSQSSRFFFFGVNTVGQ